MIGRVPLLLILFFVLHNLHAQDPFYINYDTKDGLPSSEVYDVEVDQNGLVWFTTDRGVCHYNGYEFETYTTQNGLADNTNFDIYRDAENKLWFNGYNGRVSIYENGVFRSYPYNDSLLTFIQRNWLGDMLETKDGRLLTVGVHVKGMTVLQLNENKYPEIFKEQALRDSFRVIDFLSNKIINVDKLGFHFIENKTSTKRKYTSYGVQLVRYLDDLMVYNSHHMLYKSDLEGNELQSIELGKFIVAVYVDDQKNIWACTSNGLYFFEEGDLERAPKVYFSEYVISNIVKDAEGSFWITTNQNGVLFVPSFEVDLYQGNNNKAVKEKYLSIGKLKDRIFFGAASSNIIAINKSNDVNKVYIEGQSFRQIRYIVKNGEALFFSNGVRLKEERDDVVFLKDKYSHVGFSKVLENQDLFNFGGRGFRVRAEGLKLISQMMEKPFRGNLTALSQSKNEDIWLGTLSGLYKIKDYDYEALKPVFTEGRDTFGRINDLYLDHLDNRWVATIGNGLFYHTTDSVYQIKKESGLNSDLINQILMTDDSTVWIGTNKGLNVFKYRFENSQLHFFDIKSMTIADGLSSNYINDLDYWEGKIWLATNNGVCSFDPEIINKDYPPVPVSISELIVNDSTYTVLDQLVFDYNENDVFINFTGISFKRENEKTFYRYRLKIDQGNPQWFYTNEKNIRYNNMSPGEYTFEVTAKNKSGEWTDVPAQVSFKIKAHYTETLWFKTLSVFLILGTIALIIYYQIKRFRYREIENRKLQEAQLRIREAKLAVLRNQMNPHFIFNSLNSIQNFIFKKDIEKANYYLSKFSGLIRNSLQYARLDFITLKEELDFLKNYLELESMRFSKKFDVNFKIGEQLDLDALMIPSLLLQPVLENAIKHAFKNIKYKGLLEITLLQKNEDSLDVFIRDNGPGLTKNNIVDKTIHKSKHKSLGLEIIQNRIILLKEAKYKVKASVSFKNLAEVNSDEKGLEVHFILPIKYKE